MPAHLRCGGTYSRLAAAFRTGAATVHRCIREAVEVLAASAPSLTDAMKTAAAEAYPILDGTLPPIDRIAADRSCCSGKHKLHGMNVHIPAEPVGRLIWAFPALPGAVHDLRAARTHGIIDALTEAGVPCWADKAYRGAVPGRPGALPGPPGEAVDRAAGPQPLPRPHPRSGRAGRATLKSWRLLRKLRCSTTRITGLVKEVLTLHLATPA